MNESVGARSLIEKVKAEIARHRMIRPGSGVIAAVSGGPDSVALLHLLTRLSPVLSCWVAVAHMDHGLRAESAKEAEFVRTMAVEMGLKVEVRRVDVRRVAAEQGVSLEEAGRKARYAFFEDARISCGAEVIATAHQREDALESFFLRIFRGSSLTGLRGILPVRGRIVRPLIGIPRQEVLGFLEDEHIPYVIDPTNLGTETDRNFVRNRLLLVVRERFPSFEKPLERTLDLVREEEDYLDQEAAKLWSALVSRIDNGLEINGAQLANAPGVLAARVILTSLYDLSGPETRWARTHLESILGMLRSENPSGRLDLPGGLTLLREYGRLRLMKGEAIESSSPMELSVEGPGAVELPDTGMTIRFRMVTRTKAPFEDLDGRTTALFDLEHVPFPLILRSPRPGDRFRPWGMRGSRKLKDLLIDLKVPLRQRREIPLLVKGDRILWIPGIRRSREAPVREETKRILEVSLLS
ncbi:MAG: tRNA lysidine(34) synthetase TilS [Deltaproteobacteria bacterium]